MEVFVCKTTFGWFLLCVVYFGHIYNLINMDSTKSTYTLVPFISLNEPVVFQTITFYEKDDTSTHATGTTLEEMIKVTLTRLNDLNGRFSCRENSLAITKLQEALFWLNARTDDRKARGVEGKLLK